MSVGIGAEKALKGELKKYYGNLDWNDSAEEINIEEPIENGSTHTTIMDIYEFASLDEDNKGYIFTRKYNDNFLQLIIYAQSTILLID